MRKVVIAALAAAVVLPFQSHATATADTFNLRNAQDLLDLCAVADSDLMVEAARGFCYGYLSGVNGYHRAVNGGKNARPLYCLPEKTPSRSEAATMFVSWGRSNPQHLSEAPVDALMRFAVATWPCAKKQAKR